LKIKTVLCLVFGKLLPSKQFFCTSDLSTYYCRSFCREMRQTSWSPLGKNRINLIFPLSEIKTPLRYVPVFGLSLDSCTQYWIKINL